MVDAPSLECLDYGATLGLPGSPAMSDMASQDLGAPNSQASPRSIPPPNPPFVFPVRPSSSSAPSSFSRATGRRPRSAIEPYSAASMMNIEDEKPALRSPALPSFSFNPGASLTPTPAPESMFLSPPQSPSAPNSPRLVPARPSGHGHRRGGSEFVGGSIRNGEAITITNVSPTKSESGMASPLLQPTRPRRGHAHRRSAAISSHDLASIIIPPSSTNAKGNSAPASPVVSDRPAGLGFPAPDKPVETENTAPLSVPEPCAEKPVDIPPPVQQLEQSPKAAVRNKVGFSDTLEYIPRPLSMVSTDTSSTVTARPGHSLSGSISSVISISNADRDFNHPSGSVHTPNLSDSRPSTAGAIMERTPSSQEQGPAVLRSPRRRGSIPFLGSLPPAIPLSPVTPSPTRPGKKWSFFGLDPFVTSSPTRPQPDSPRSTHSHLSVTERSSAERAPDFRLDGPEDNADAPKPANKKRSKKPKKVKTWAGSILSRKGKHRHGKPKRRTPTPPPMRHCELFDDLDDGAMHISLDSEPSMPPLTLTQSPGNGDWETWTFPKPSSLPDEDTSYQMIDLDAALGPFNTPLPRNPEWEAAQRAGGHVKKQLHSAAGMSRFSGPGMHYHRRAESAPELVPFEGGRFGFRRFGSSSTMADVFEEDEEEEEEDSASCSTGQSTPAAEIHTADKSEITTHSEEESTVPEVRQHRADSGSAVSTPARVSQSVIRGSALDPTPNLTCDDELLGEAGPGCLDAPRASFSADTDFGSATPSPRHAFRPKDLAPVELSPLNLPTASLGPASPWSMTQSSAFPSPRSPMSYDAQCISTAPSSVTEDNFQSLLMGEPGPEVRISVDDIPSLTSSNSTMTRDSLFGQHPQARYPLGEQPRPASFTSTAFGRRRSSLASLSRLINSSHGERSKLSIEVPMDSEADKKSKGSKTKRLSRMMQFWKSKEPNTT